jgi:hypothetical protein
LKSPANKGLPMWRRPNLRPFDKSATSAMRASFGLNLVVADDQGQSMIRSLAHKPLADLSI